MSNKAITQSSDANVIIGYLSTIPIGDEVTIADIEANTGLKLHGGSSSSALATARSAMLEDMQIFFKSISGKLRRLTDEEKISEAKRITNVADRKHRRAVEVASSVHDYDAMSQEAKDDHTSVIVKSVVVGRISQQSVIGNLVALAKTRGGISSVTISDILLISSKSVP